MREIVALGSCYRTLWRCKWHRLYIDLLKSLWIQVLPSKEQERRPRNALGQEPYRSLVKYSNTFLFETRLIIEWMVNSRRSRIPDDWCLLRWDHMTYSHLQWMGSLQGAENARTEENFWEAIANGYLPVAQWIFKSHFMITTEVLLVIAENGHFHCLLWLIKDTNDLIRNATLNLVRRINFPDQNRLKQAHANLMVKLKEYMDKLQKQEKQRIQENREWTTRQKIAIIKALTNRQKISIIKALCASEQIHSENTELNLNLETMTRQNFKKHILKDLRVVGGENDNIQSNMNKLEWMSALLHAVPQLVDEKKKSLLENP